MVLFWVITAALGATVIYLLYWLSNSSRNYWEKQGVPYVDGLPVVGILKDLVLMRKGMGEILVEIYRNYDQKKFVAYHQFLAPTIMIRDPELVNQVLIKDFVHFEDRGPPVNSPNDLFSKAFGNLTGDDWRNVRHKLTPTFTSGKMRMMFESMKQCSENVVAYLQNKTDQDIESRGLMTKYVLNVIGKIAFGLEIDTLNEKEEKSAEFFKHSTLFFKPSFSLVLKFLISLSAPTLRDIFKMKLTDGNVDKFFTDLTKDIIKFRQGNDVKRNDFLQLMLDLKKKEEENLSGGLGDVNTSTFESEPIESEDKELMSHLENTLPKNKTAAQSEIFTDDFIAAQTFIFISGGSETVAAVLTFIFFELAQNPDLQKKVQEEISNVTSTSGLNYESLKKLTYMEQFIYETFRIHPLGPVLMRYCTKDYKIPGTEVIIKKGNLVHIPISGLQTDAQYFPEPEKFDPDRFRDMDAVPKGVFFPFGGGPRMCIAMRLSMLEMKVILATLLSTYSLSLSKQTKVPLQLTKTSFLVCVDGGVWVKFHKRNA